MSAPEYQATATPAEKEITGAPSSTTGADLNGAGHPQHQHQRNTNDYGNPQYHAHAGQEARLAAFGGEFQPGLWRTTEHRKFANPAPLGLSAFALTTFVLSLVNLQTRGVAEPNIALSLAYGYGGLVQLLSGMW